MGAWARAGWRVWDLGNGTIMLQKLFNPEWQITSKSFLLSSFLIGFSFSLTAEISRLELEFEESLPRKTASKRGLDGSKMEQPIDNFHKWRPVINSFANIKISLSNLILKLIIQKSFYSETRFVRLI